MVDGARASDTPGQARSEPRAPRAAANRSGREPRPPILTRGEALELAAGVVVLAWFARRGQRSRAHNARHNLTVTGVKIAVRSARRQLRRRSFEVSSHTIE